MLIYFYSVIACHSPLSKPCINLRQSLWDILGFLGFFLSFCTFRSDFSIRLFHNLPNIKSHGHTGLWKSEYPELLPALHLFLPYAPESSLSSTICQQPDHVRSRSSGFLNFSNSGDGKLVLCLQLNTHEKMQYQDIWGEHNGQHFLYFKCLRQPRGTRILCEHLKFRGKRDSVEESITV